MEQLLLPVAIEKDTDGYFAYCPQLQGCYTQGDTYEEVLENIRDAIGLHIEDRLADGEPLPEYEPHPPKWITPTLRGGYER